MTHKLSRIAILVIVLLSFTSCSVIEGIFKAGMGVGIFIVVAIVALIIFFITRIGGKKE
ncbi:hypothetical protein [Flavobacterium sp. GT3R68]|uniref:hypothetical protein n=1 Tax=Flavobacterium sp. GT3R68 TaxID=2594437 RepID=UPI00163D6309|nr:hypothetical protein [Flavobacterium sp. GT3R68]